MRTITFKHKALAVAASLAMLSSLVPGSATAQTPPAPAVELSTSACAKSITQQQVDELVRYMVRNDQTPAATGCYWALNDADRVRVSDAFVLAMGYPKEKLEADRIARAAPRSTRPVPPIERARRGDTAAPSTPNPAAALVEFWANEAERVPAGNGVQATTHRQANLCDGDSGDNDWEYDFPLRIYAGEPERIRWFANDWWVDSWLSGYPGSRINSYGYLGDAVTWVCLGDRAWSAGLGNVQTHLRLWVQY